MKDEPMEEGPLPIEVLASLRVAPSPPETLEAKTLARLREASMVGTRPLARTMRWIPQAIAATLLFGVGVAFGTWNAHRTEQSNRTAAQHIESTAAAYIKALSAASPNDSASHEAASSTFREASAQIIEIFPNDQLGFALRLVLAGTQPVSKGITGKEEHKIWF